MQVPAQLFCIDVHSRGCEPEKLLVTTKTVCHAKGAIMMTEYGISGRTTTAGMVVFLLLSITAPMQALADDAPSAEEVETNVSDHTYQGSMSVAGSGFAEYYAADGSIKANDYSGAWRAEDGAMCFQYGDKPESCFEVRFHGPSMEMYKDGELDGNGMLIEGNPNDF
jgi:hypothetical protein